MVLAIAVTAFAEAPERSDSPAANPVSGQQVAPVALTPVTAPIPMNLHANAVEAPAKSPANGLGGNITPGFSASFFDGDIAEVILYNRTLSDQERIDVANYVQNKYNLGGFETPAAPVAPSGLVSSNPSSNSVSLSWNSSSGGAGITGYQIYAGSTLVASTAGTFYNLTGLAGGATYNFAVLAVDSLGRVSAASPALSVTTSAPWPYDPYGYSGGDTIPNYEAVQIGTQQAAILTVTIAAPANGSTVP
jgi:hypothetical protein